MAVWFEKKCVLTKGWLGSSHGKVFILFFFSFERSLFSCTYSSRRPLETTCQVLTMNTLELQLEYIGIAVGMALNA